MYGSGNGVQERQARSLYVSSNPLEKREPCFFSHRRQCNNLAEEGELVLYAVRVGEDVMYAQTVNGRRAGLARTSSPADEFI